MAAVMHNVEANKTQAIGHDQPKPTKLLRRPRPPKAKLIPPQPPPKPSNYNPFLDPNDDTCNSIARISPAPSVVPSLASLTPSDRMRSEREMSRLSRQYSQIPFNIDPHDKAYILDPNLYRRDPTQLGPLVSGKSLMKTYKPRGPDGLPSRVPKTSAQVNYNDLVLDESELRYLVPPEFTMNNFIVHLSNLENVPVERVRKTMYSKNNYRRLTKLVQERMKPRNANINRQELVINEGDIPDATPRVPQKQLLLEMAAIVCDQIKKYMETDVKAVIKTLPRYHPNVELGAAPHTEILLYEDDTEARSRMALQIVQDTELPGSDALFHSSTARYFQGAKRSNSPFAAAGQDGEISPAELAILDSLLSGGTALSVKAHFISQLPDVTPLMNTVTYVNLSFNDFAVLPSEICELRQLQVLKLRNNPLIELPHEIYKLRNLRTLVASFCLLSNLPMSLYTLKKLQHLDVSYNRLSFLPNEIKSLSALRELILEGNQLPALPAGALNLNLRCLRVRNNYMHPLFWRENTQNQPQRLVDIAALSFSNAGLQHRHDNIPENILLIIRSYASCDCCKGTLYGPGLRLIRPATKIFGIKNLPFLFNSCSSYCAKLFMQSSDALTEILYEKERQEGNEL